MCPFASDVLQKCDNCGYSVYIKCYKQKFDKTLRQGASWLGQRVVADTIKDLVTGIADFSDLEESDIHPGIKQSISEYCEVMMSIK